MDEINLPEGCEIVEGPTGLTKGLEALLANCKADPTFALQPHYLLYQLRNQQALIKIDMSTKPYQFWYGDLLGRPATKIVKETIAKFLWEKCGEKEVYFREQKEKLDE